MIVEESYWQSWSCGKNWFSIPRQTLIHLSSPSYDMRSLKPSSTWVTRSCMGWSFFFCSWSSLVKGFSADGHFFLNLRMAVVGPIPVSSFDSPLSAAAIWCFVFWSHSRLLPYQWNFPIPSAYILLVILHRFCHCLTSTYLCLHSPIKCGILPISVHFLKAASINWQFQVCQSQPFSGTNLMTMECTLHTLTHSG